jgi:hypothetical protein
MAFFSIGDNNRRKNSPRTANKSKKQTKGKVLELFFF